MAENCVLSCLEWCVTTFSSFDKSFLCRFSAFYEKEKEKKAQCWKFEIFLGKKDAGSDLVSCSAGVIWRLKAG